MSEPLPPPPLFAGFGEIMLRLSPPGHQRLSTATTFDACYGGAEANVAVSLAQFGIPSRLITAVPENDIGQAAVNALRSRGVDTSQILRTGERLGVYYLEHGASQRPSAVVYDRAGSSIGKLDPSAIDWDAALKGATWFHFTGITPALSDTAAESVAQGKAAASRLGLVVSCDLNYRSKLWSRAAAQVKMTELMSGVDVLFANEEDAEAVFGIHPKEESLQAGKPGQARFVDVAAQLSERFGLTTVAITVRESISASRNGWSAVLLRAGESFQSRRYEIDVVDRVGTGDSFAAGLIYGLLKYKSPAEALEFATAASCLKHSVPGDFNVCSVAEVEALLKSGGTGRVQR